MDLAWLSDTNIAIRQYPVAQSNTLAKLMSGVSSSDDVTFSLCSKMQAQVMLSGLLTCSILSGTVVASSGSQSKLEQPYSPFWVDKRKNKRGVPLDQPIHSLPPMRTVGQ